MMAHAPAVTHGYEIAINLDPMRNDPFDDSRGITRRFTAISLPRSTHQISPTRGGGGEQHLQQLAVDVCIAH